MITEAQWAALRAAVDRVCNRESDIEDLQFATVNRSRYGSNIGVWFYSGQADLEPEEHAQSSKQRQR